MKQIIRQVPDAVMTESDDSKSVQGTVHGINWVIGAMFILGDLVGGGVVAMPAGFVNTGLAIGIIFMILICTFFLSTGWLLSDSWSIMRARYPEYRSHCRSPYPEIGRRSMGRNTEIATQVLVYFTLIGTAIVYLLLSSQVFHTLLGYANIRLNFCYLLLIVAMAVLPVTFLKSPADFWLAIVVAVLCTVIAVLLIIVGVSLDLTACYSTAHYPGPSTNSILSLGIFLFAFNGHQVFPTVQNDMRHPDQFKKSVILGFFLVALLYMPLSAYSFLVYGDSMLDSVIDSVQTTWIRDVSDLAIAVHCILTIIITVNPINLQIEHTFSVPQRFCVQRVLTRTSLMGVILFIALTIPNFSSVMNLFGSTTIPITCVVLPSLFNIYLKAAVHDKKTGEYIKPSLKEVFQRSSRPLLSWIIIINAITIICAMISTYMGVKAILTINFTPPCYILPFLNTTDIYEVEVINCCGKYYNISRALDVGCSIKKQFR